MNSSENGQKKPKVRIDKFLVDQNLATTRARAQAMILAGNVLVNDVPVTKAGDLISPAARVRLKEPELKYVSRGALKLKRALDHFQINVEKKIAIDVGASTGGFTEILLERGAKKVHAVDVGTNQLAWKIRNDPRVNVRENYNARTIQTEDFDGPIEILVMDVSFISVRLILPAAVQVLATHADLVVLFKPQFELGREAVGEGGIVRDQVLAQQNLRETEAWGASIGLVSKGTTESPITGTDGNHEYLIHWQKS